jgi:uncharacterized membrane protein
VSGWLSRGLAAGAVGTALLDAATYADMLVSGREASDAPGRTVLGLAKRAGVDPPSRGGRVPAYGQLGGLAAGLGIGVAASAARAAGLRLPAPLAVAATGLAAMAATDAPMAAAGVSDPRTWSAGEWARDAVPHLAFGAGVRWTIDRMDDSVAPVRSDEPAPATLGLLLRSTALGLATGARSSLSLFTPALSGGAGPAAGITGALVATELVIDKLPSTQSRLAPQGFLSRVPTGGLGAAALARREHRRGRLPAIAGAAGAFAGTIAGAAWRDAAADRGWTWQAALVEDAAALGLVALAVRRSHS